MVEVAGSKAKTTGNVDLPAGQDPQCQADLPTGRDSQRQAGILVGTLAFK
jgi:hypothetical protein